MNPLLEIKRLCKHFDGIKALDEFSMNVDKGELVGLIGPNGAGKSTLFNVMTGFLKADKGFIRFNGKSVLGNPPYKTQHMGMTRTFQNLRIIRQMSIIENVMFSFPDQKGESLWQIFFRPASVSANEKKLREKGMALLEFAGLAEQSHRPAEMLSYGQQKLLALICALAAEPLLLLLDEPVAGINPAMIDKILQIVQDLPGKGTTVLLIEHDMAAVFSICKRVIFMDQGRLISEGKPGDVQNDPKVIEAYLD